MEVQINQACLKDCDWDYVYIIHIYGRYDVYKVNGEFLHGNHDNYNTLDMVRTECSLHQQFVVAVIEAH